MWPYILLVSIILIGLVVVYLVMKNRKKQSDDLQMTLLESSAPSIELESLSLLTEQDSSRLVEIKDGPILA